MKEGRGEERREEMEGKSGGQARGGKRRRGEGRVGVNRENIWGKSAY